jgi:NHL repeat
MYIADTLNNRIEELNLSGGYVNQFSTGLNQPQGIALAPDGSLWVADTMNNRIVHLSSTLTDLGDTFGSLGSANNQFFQPHSLAVYANGGNPILFVADTYNNRIQEFSLGSTPPPAAHPYTAITPFRVCDTRPAAPGIVANQCDAPGNGPIGALTPRVVTIEGLGSQPVPSGATAVVVNVTAIAPTQATFVTLYPDLTGNPGTSNLNVSAGQVVANLVEVGLSAGGKIDVLNAAGTINVALDIEGYVSSASTGLYNALAAPVRICDTRAAAGAVRANQCNVGGAHPIVSTGPVLTFNVNTLTDGVPSSGVTAVVFNLTAIAPSQPTVLTAYPADVSRPEASNINLNPGTAVPNRIIVPVSSTGTVGNVSIWNGAGSVNVAVDIAGWFQATTGKQFTPLARPFRVCNTQNGNPADGGETTGCAKATVSGGTALNIDVTGIDGIPQEGNAGAPTAIVANVTAVNATTGTFITVYPGPNTSPVPNASDLNVASYLPVPNLVVVTVDSVDGTINLYNALGNVNLIVDIYGYYS